MASLAVGYVQFVKNVVIQIPLSTIDIMQTVRPVGRQRKSIRMAGFAFDNWSGVN